MILDFNNSSLLFNAHSLESAQSLYVTVCKFKPKKIFLDSSDEFAFNGGFHNSYFLKIREYIQENNVDAHMFLGSTSIEEYSEEDQKSLEPFKVHFFPFNFISKEHNHVTNLANPEILQLRDTREFSKFFYILVNRPHTYRCLFIDCLHKHKLHELGKFTWNKLTIDYLGFKYRFKYWKEELIKANDNYNGKHSIATPEDLYFDSLFDIVLESTMDVTFITEKTLKPLVYGKPFIVFSKQGFHRNLARLGYKLYDEVVNYKFDTIEDLQKRTEAFCLELKRINETYSYSEIYKLLLPKIKYNRELVKNHARIHKNSQLNILNNHFSDLSLYSKSFKL